MLVKSPKSFDEYTGDYTSNFKLEFWILRNNWHGQNPKKNIVLLRVYFDEWNLAFDIDSAT